MSESSIPTYDLLASTTEIDDIRDYIEDAQIIEFSSDSLLSVHPGKILLNDDKIIALSNGVYQFDTFGNLIGQAGRHGNGPGEYLGISDICLSNDKTYIFCLDFQNNILIYDANSLEFIKSIESGLFGMTSEAVVPYQQDGFALLVNNPSDPSDFENEFFCLKCFDSKGNLVEELLPRDDFNISMSFFSPSTQGYENKYYLSYIPSEGTFYQIVDGNIRPFVNLSFGNKSLPYRYAIHEGKEPWSYVGDIFENGYYKCVSTLCSTDELMYCYAFGADNSKFHFLIDQQTGKGIRWKAFNWGNLMAAIASDNEYFYYSYSADWEDAKKSPHYSPDILKAALEEKLNLHYTEDDDPVIVKVKYRLND